MRPELSGPSSVFSGTNSGASSGNQQPLAGERVRNLLAESTVRRLLQRGLSSRPHASTGARAIVAVSAHPGHPHGRCEGDRRVDRLARAYRSADPKSEQELAPLRLFCPYYRQSPDPWPPSSKPRQRYPRLLIKSIRLTSASTLRSYWR